MDEKLFSELIDSVEEMDKIRRGERRASRRTVVKEIKVAAVREQTGLSQNALRAPHRRQQTHRRELGTRPAETERSCPGVA
jgi:hypothetical protein